MFSIHPISSADVLAAFIMTPTIDDLITLLLISYATGTHCAITLEAKTRYHSPFSEVTFRGFIRLVELITGAIFDLVQRGTGAYSQAAIDEVHFVPADRVFLDRTGAMMDLFCEHISGVFILTRINTRCKNQLVYCQGFLTIQFAKYIHRMHQQN